MRSDEEIEARDGQAVSGATDAAQSGCELTLGRSESRFRIVDTAGAGVVARLAPSLPPGAWLAVNDTSPTDIRYVVENWQPSWGAGGVGYRVLRDGKLRYLGWSVDRLAQWLQTDIEEQASRHPGAAVPIQASTVVWRERAIVIPGRCRTDTSRLVAELVRLGANLYADDITVLDYEGRAHPNGQRPGSAAPGVTLVVSTTYQPALTWQPQLLRGARAVLPIIDSALPERDETRPLLRLCAQLARAVVTLQGPRSEASLAAPGILTVLDGLLDRRAPGDAVVPQERRLVSRARAVLAAQRVADGSA